MVGTEETSLDLFDFPQEPHHEFNAVGEPLVLTSFLDKEDFISAKKLSKVGPLNETAAEGLLSYAGFISVQEELWKSNLFFWFFPAEENPEEKPLLVWLQVRLHSLTFENILAML